VKRAWLSGGSRDGEQVVFQTDAPASLVIDGEPYRLVSTKTPRVYVYAGRRPWAPFTEAEKRDVVRHVAAGESVQRAAQIVGVSSAAVYRHRRIDPDFREALERARTGVPPVDEVHEGWRWSGFQPIPFVGGVNDGLEFEYGPATLVESDEERYRLTIDAGRLMYVAESAADAVRELTFRRYEREDEDAL
jgi:hypothetical protein